MFSLALKNILFYRARAITTFILTFVTTLLFIVYVALMDGSHGSMLKNALKVYMGAIEIYKKGYRDMGGSEYLIEDVNAITTVLKEVEGITHFAPRYESFGLLSFKNHSAAAMVAGVVPEVEAEMTQLKVALREGEYLRDNGCLYMGEGLATKLHVRVHDELSYISSASDNSFVAEIFSLCGIFKTGMFAFDTTSAFMDKEYLDRVMYSENRASYITLWVDDLERVDAIATVIDKRIGSAYEVVTWKVLMRAMLEAMEIDSIFGYVSMGLFFVVIFFVIMIFTFINVSSRIKEFGVLRAIGVSQKEISWLLLYEMFILSSGAVLLATPIGAFIAYYFSLHPIVIEGISETYKIYGVVSDEVPFNFDLFTIGWNVALIYLLNFLSLLYPLVYINRFRPVEAMRHV